MEPWFAQTLSDLDRHEGFRPFPYPDPLSKLGQKYKSRKWNWGYEDPQALLAKYKEKASDGYPWTNGHGFTHGVTPATPEISHKDSLDKLDNELIRHLPVLDTLVPEWKEFPLHVKTVLASLAYNLGLGRLSKFKATLAAFNGRHFHTAARNLELSLWYTQTGTRARELVERLKLGKVQEKYKVKTPLHDFSNVITGSSTKES